MAHIVAGCCRIFHCWQWKLTQRFCETMPTLNLTQQLAMTMLNGWKLKLFTNKTMHTRTHAHAHASYPVMRQPSSSNTCTANTAANRSLAPPMFGALRPAALENSINALLCCWHGNWCWPLLVRSLVFFPLRTLKWVQVWRPSFPWQLTVSFCQRLWVVSMHWATI